MNAWINQLAELVGIGSNKINVSLTDMTQMIPDARLLWLAGAAVAFILVVSFDNRYHKDHQSDSHHK